MIISSCAGSCRAALAKGQYGNTDRGPVLKVRGELTSIVGLVLHSHGRPRTIWSRWMQIRHQEERDGLKISNKTKYSQTHG